MFDWLGDIISGIGSAIGDTIDFIGSGLGDAIWNAMLKWLYNNSNQHSDTCTNRNSKKILQKRPCQHTYATTDNKSC